MILDIHATENATEEILRNTKIFSEDVTRIFTPEYFKENKYLGAVTLSEDLSYPNFEFTHVVQKFIALTQVDFYSFAFFDTSAITVSDFGEHFETYKVET